MGWGLGMPSIQRRNLSGLPHYERDPAQGMPLQTMTDRFVFDGAPLVPLCTVGIGPVCPAGEDFSQWSGWHYFRLQVDTMHARFFWSADNKTWRVQFPSGNVMEFGAPHENPNDSGGLEFEDPLRQAPPFRWNLIREWDSVRWSGIRSNVVVYQWGVLPPQRQSFRKFLTDEFDTPSQNGGSLLQYGRVAAGEFAHHTHTHLHRRSHQRHFCTL